MEGFGLMSGPFGGIGGSCLALREVGKADLFGGGHATLTRRGGSGPLVSICGGDAVDRTFGDGPRGSLAHRMHEIWLILPVVIRFSQRLSHASLPNTR